MKREIVELSQERLSKLLEYDPWTGLFTWRVDRMRVHEGEIAGKRTPCGYIEIGIDSRRYQAHRLAFLYMTGEMPTKYVDHVNLDRSDNRWCNLREATNSQNQMNVARMSRNTSGFKGVSWHKNEKQWRADIRIGGKKKCLGYFPAPEIAHAAYCKAAKIHHGEFARTH